MPCRRRGGTLTIFFRAPCWPAAEVRHNTQREAGLLPRCVIHPAGLGIALPYTTARKTRVMNRGDGLFPTREAAPIDAPSLSVLPSCRLASGVEASRPAGAGEHSAARVDPVGRRFSLDLSRRAERRDRASVVRCASCNRKMCVGSSSSVSDTARNTAASLAHYDLLSSRQCDASNDSRVGSLLPLLLELKPSLLELLVDRCAGVGPSRLKRRAKRRINRVHLRKTSCLSYSCSHLCFRILLSMCRSN